MRKLFLLLVFSPFPEHLFRLAILHLKSVPHFLSTFVQNFAAAEKSLVVLAH